jgi:uncharacterized protein
MVEPPPRRQIFGVAMIKKRWRSWLRAFHRDVGYLVVGLTFIYALSGLAINHVDDWDPNYKNVSRSHQIAADLPADDAEAATAIVLAQLGIDEEPTDAYMATDTELEIYFSRDQRAVRVEVDTGRAFEEAQEPRFFLRMANWLHYNRSKDAWTYIADAYAILLLFLATSGLFMLKGRKGLVGRGAILVFAGVAVPIAYVTLSGGPGG